MQPVPFQISKPRQRAENAEKMMPTYQYPYLSPHQTRLHEPTVWQQELANAIEGVFAKGAEEFDELVAGLNASRVRPPSGGEWTEANLSAVLRELGA